MQISFIHKNLSDVKVLQQQFYLHLLIYLCTLSSLRVCVTNGIGSEET